MIFPAIISPQLCKSPLHSQLDFHPKAVCCFPHPLTRPWVALLGVNFTCQTQQGKTIAMDWLYFPNPLRSLISNTKKWYPWELPWKPIQAKGTINSTSREKASSLPWALFTLSPKEEDEVYNGTSAVLRVPECQEAPFSRYLEMVSPSFSPVCLLYCWISIEFTDQCSEMTELQPWLNFVFLPSFSFFSSVLFIFFSSCLRFKELNAWVPYILIYF